MWNDVKHNGRKLASSLFSAIFPSICPRCKNPSDNLRHAPICKECWGTIRKYAGPACAICAVPLVSEYSTVCGGCLKKPPRFSKVLNFGLYSGALSEAIYLYKFSGLRRLAGPLGRLLTGLPINDADGIVPVPVTEKTLRRRGFNQTLLLSKRVSRHLDIPVYMDLLHKERETLPQIGLGAKERMNNLKNVFSVDGKISGMRLMLLDDVMTTGATVRECSRVLRKAGAEEVIVVTLARSVLI